MLAIISSRYQYGPFLFFFVAEVMSNYLTTDGLNIFSLLPEAPWGLRPVAFATSATWLIRHWIRVETDEQTDRTDRSTFLDNAVGKSPGTRLFTNCPTIYHKIMLSLLVCGPDIWNSLPLNVHVYSQRVQKYTTSSRTRNVKKPCLH